MISFIYILVQISPSEAKMYLHLNRWSASEVIQMLTSQSTSATVLSSTTVNNTIPSHLQVHSPQSAPSVVTSQHQSLASHNSSNTPGRQPTLGTTSSPLSASSQSIANNPDRLPKGSLSQTTSTISSSLKSLQNSSSINTPPSTNQKAISTRQRASTDGKLHPLVAGETFLFCDVCAVTQASTEFSHLSCRHLFCKGCWELHFECQILQGLSTSELY